MKAQSMVTSSIFSQINRTIVKEKDKVRMNSPNKTKSQLELEAEWLEIQKAQTNPASFRPLYQRYFEPIFRFIVRRTADEALAADICSQVFLKALQKIKNYQFRGVPFSAWLYRIASNEITQYYRNNNKKRAISIDSTQIPEIIEELETNDNEEHRKVMLVALKTLPPDQVQLIELRFFEQRPFKEIAQILNITEANAKVKTYRILARLKKAMLKIMKKSG